MLGALSGRRRQHAARGHRSQRRHRLEDVLLPALPGQCRRTVVRRATPAALGTDDREPDDLAEQAARLPDSVTGGGNNGIEPGAQVVCFASTAPSTGSISDIMIDGSRVGARRGP